MLILDLSLKLSYNDKADDLTVNNSTKVDNKFEFQMSDGLMYSYQLRGQKSMFFKIFFIFF